MAKFEPGNPGGPGRPPGTPSAKRLLAAVSILADAGRHPILELVKIADETKDPDKREERWLRILSYCEAPVPARTVSSSPEESVARASEVAAHLSELSKPLEPAPVPAHDNKPPQP
jgi:hypothetical protein